MRRISLPTLGVVGRVAAALCAVLIALAGLAAVAVRSTHEATSGADGIESEFAERVATGTALSTAQRNFRIATERLRATSPRELRALDRELTSSDARLAADFASAVTEENERRSVEARQVAPLRRAYPRYLRIRGELLRRRDQGASAESLDPAFERSFAPLREGLRRYANVHFRESEEQLAALREDSRARELVLIAMLVFGLLSLLAILTVIRGVAVHLREYVGFAGRVADGDLGTRLEPKGNDELTTLARCFNAMVEQLSVSSTQRDDSRNQETSYRTAQDAFSEILQVTETEPEAHALLKRHIERGVQDSRVVVLNKNNSKDRLEATTELPEGSPLALPLETAEPRACLSVRLGRVYDSGSQVRSLLECEICGLTAEQSTCVPLLVSGEVIGSVLIDHAQPFGPADERCVNESVAQAAPTLANLRNLALAEARAATDSLTGLPNRRAVQDTMKRMLAHAARSATPLAAVLLDLDHFKQINDTFGHEEGDTVLAAVGDVLSSNVRASDFVGRNGGEEFVALLPDTGEAGALALAEKLRLAIGAVTLTRVDRPISASFGVAVFPDVAADAETLLRLADRALYSAKGSGRNRVELATTGSEPMGVELEPDPEVRVPAVTR